MMDDETVTIDNKSRRKPRARNKFPGSLPSAVIDTALLHMPGLNDTRSETNTTLPSYMDHYTLRDTPSVVTIQKPPSDNDRSEIDPGSEYFKRMQGKSKTTGKWVWIVVGLVFMISITLISIYATNFIKSGESDTDSATKPEDFCKDFGITDEEARQRIKNNLKLEGRYLTDFGSPCVPASAFTALSDSLLLQLNYIEYMHIKDTDLAAIHKNAFLFTSINTIDSIVFDNITTDLEFPTGIFDNFRNLYSFEIYNSHAIKLDNNIFGRTEYGYLSIVIQSSGLTKFPGMLRNFKDIHHLHLMDNNINDLSSDPFGVDTRIYELDLRNNPVAELGSDYIKQSLNADIDKLKV